MCKRLLIPAVVFVASLMFAMPALASLSFQRVGYKALNLDGSAAMQAGSHSWELQTSFFVNSRIDGLEREVPDQDIKDVDAEPPLGLVGNPTVTPKCSIEQFTTPPNKEVGVLTEGSSYLWSGASCPNDTQVGVADIKLPGGYSLGVFNLVPPRGVPAEFGFNFVGSPIILTASLRSDGSYGLVINARDASQALNFFGATVTLWGSPGDPRHDALRGECLGESGQPVAVPGGCHTTLPVRPFLNLPTSCPGGPSAMSIRADAWQNPGVFISAEPANVDAQGNPVPLTGCANLDFSPSLTITPQSKEANAPTGLEADLSVPQNENPAGLAESHVKDASVTLPPGMVVNPSAAEGREACSSVQVDLDAQTPAKCPDAAKVGTVVATTPLLEEPLEGSLYLAQQEANPFKSLLAVYIVAENASEGVHVKLAGQIHADPSTGQLTSTFDGNRVYGLGSALEGEPQLPFSDLKLKFFGGPRAALVNPDCGTYAPSSVFTPWSGGPAFSPAMASFALHQNCGGGFAPALSSGTSSNQAGSFSPFVTTISRSDLDQRLGRVSVTVPPGLLGMLSRVSLCPQAQAQTGNCPVASQIGHLNATAGAGPDPVALPQAGKQEDPVFLTAPYNGGPFGLSILVHAQAGPFDLGDLVVRAGIHVDPATAQITVITDPLPSILRGIPLDVRSATVTIDRAGTLANGFIFNPTNCNPLTVTGTVSSTQGASANVSNRFQAANCATLPFKPSFKASTRARTSKARGASLIVKVTSTTGQANITRVDLQLPKQLPARLTTLQKACTEAQFATNPAGCPAASVIGTAKAITPVLNVPLIGPAYLVSHGGAAFPDIEFILQGQGVRIDLDGRTQIKKGITYSRFETVPDAPISSFETVLPQGPHSVLATDLPVKAKGSLCGSKLTIPTTLTGQNGTVIKQNTPISVTGCPRARQAARHKTTPQHKPVKARTHQ